MKHTISTSLLVFASLQLLQGQSATVLKREINRLATAVEKPDQDAAIEELVSNAIKVRAARVDLVTHPESSKKQVEELLAFRRADVQSGASSGSSGSTSSVLSPLLPAIFGFAFETGGITRTVSGNTITLKANPAALICASSSQPGIAQRVERRDLDVCKTFWKRLGLTASFDTGRGDKSKDLANLEAVNNQFTDFTARFELLNRRTPGTLSQFEAKAKELANTVAAFNAKNPAFEPNVGKAIRAQVEDIKWSTLSPADRAKRIADAIDAAVTDDVENILVPWVSALKAYTRAIANKAVITAEYGYQQPDLATDAIGTDPVVVPKGIRPPNLHSARLIYAQGIGSRNLDFTANLSGSWFDDVRPGMSGSFRDFRAGIEGKFKLREIANYGAPTLSFAGLYVYLHQRPLGIGIPAFNQSDINTRGNIGLFQTKVEFPTANNNIRIPVSFTYSNRTELIKESDVRGQIGVSFNLGSLFGEKK